MFVDIHNKYLELTLITYEDIQKVKLLIFFFNLTVQFRLQKYIKFLKISEMQSMGGDRGTVRGGVGSGRKSDGVKNDQNFKCSLEPREHSPKIF